MSEFIFNKKGPPIGGPFFGGNFRGNLLAGICLKARGKMPLKPGRKFAQNLPGFSGTVEESVKDTSLTQFVEIKIMTDVERFEALNPEYMASQEAYTRFHARRGWLMLQYEEACNETAEERWEAELKRHHESGVTLGYVSAEEDYCGNSH